MKKLSLLMSVIFLMMVLAACGGSSKSDDTEKSGGSAISKTEPEEIEVDNELSNKTEVEAYLDEIRSPYLELGVLGERWNEVRGASAAGEIDDSELYDIIHEEILPINLELMERFEAAITTNDEMTELNELLIDALGNQQLAFTEILSALETGDSSKITSANELLNNVRKSDREFSRSLEKLLIKYDIDAE